ncbi:uncharacterized protein EAF01_000569 [Botrytis porri]|uniref:Uncharacterized protein n=1 Tax=Botrytis porri TaxID=87229 RepID=A0A4Z1L0Y6_9HELO|nr:uncharacterized protein EAF01_000569 [Botrytis porri]KAF7914163.1 hypothetical protein EAF01_000569 [Botrytis porri]TGO90410.1 hypothetical protein BPOR_0066g00200 [Botrytis porri]
MAFTTRSFSFISLSHPCTSSSPSPYSPPASSKSRSKPPKYARKARPKSTSKYKRNYAKEKEQERERELLTEISKGRKDEECPCPSCAYPDVDSGGSEYFSSSSSSSSLSSLDNHELDSEGSLSIVRVENRGKLFEQRERRRGGELKMKWGLAWSRGRGRRTEGRGYGYGYEYGKINTYAGVS